MQCACQSSDDINYNPLHIRGLVLACRLFSTHTLHSTVTQSSLIVSKRRETFLLFSGAFLQCWVSMFSRCGGIAPSYPTVQSNKSLIRLTLNTKSISKAKQFIWGVIWCIKISKQFTDKNLLGNLHVSLTTCERVVIISWLSPAFMMAWPFHRIPLFL